ncbi:hypothetical protein CIHG_05112 [Coccidioides immitis H538.4]|uniref:Uncharacterized protein n=3 Tax=Coccidioides immitis TaxID=5501 RepID=A0A0J8U4M2_COCIT|nr:hypothetical protein CIRG_00215 [Coccidioides immitis RMSCC 2394]KMU81837.1 hypothetical protein CISG_02853 [Coccidioides immitis RMSCC 3703]KMU87171.1 hypothetical protein CIHG_05112 [Coccidioides immitis H538.4]
MARAGISRRLINCYGPSTVATSVNNCPMMSKGTWRGRGVARGPQKSDSGTAGDAISPIFLGRMAMTTKSRADNGVKPVPRLQAPEDGPLTFSRSLIRHPPDEVLEQRDNRDPRRLLEHTLIDARQEAPSAA